MNDVAWISEKVLIPSKDYVTLMEQNTINIHQNGRMHI